MKATYLKIATILTFKFFSLAAFSYNIEDMTQGYTLSTPPPEGWLSLRPPEDPENNCLIHPDVYEQDWNEDFDVDVLGVKRCGPYGIGGAFKLVGLWYSELDNNLKAGCQIKTEYEACGYESFDCHVIDNAKIIFSDQIERDYCGELQEKTEISKKTAPIINYLILE